MASSILNACELYKLAVLKQERHTGKKSGQYYLHHSGLTMRVVYLLRRGKRNGRYIKYINDDFIINIDNIRQDVISGEILKVRGLGKFSFLEICKWLSDKDSDKDYENLHPASQ